MDIPQLTPRVAAFSPVRSPLYPSNPMGPVPPGGSEHPGAEAAVPCLWPPLDAEYPGRRFCSNSICGADRPAKSA
ncbi:DUF2082 domain-containing protein, partial [Dysosmobacter welbionis]